MLTPPRVYAYEVADELSVDPATFSKTINGRGRLPAGQGAASIAAAIKACKRRKGAAA